MSVISRGWCHASEYVRSAILNAFLSVSQIYSINLSLDWSHHTNALMKAVTDISMNSYKFKFVSVYLAQVPAITFKSLGDGWHFIHIFRGDSVSNYTWKYIPIIQYSLKDKTRDVVNAEHCRNIILYPSKQHGVHLNNWICWSFVDYEDRI